MDCANVSRLRSGLNRGELFVCPDHLDQRQRSALETTLQEHPLEVTRVTDDVFRKLAYGNRAEGVILVAPRPDASLQTLTLADNPLVAVLDHVEKPGNLGAVIRTADAAGISAIVVADGGTDLYNPNAIRSSLGAIFQMPMASGSVDDVVEWLRAQRLTIFTTRVDGAVNYTDVDLRSPAAIVLGCESRGLSDRWRDHDMQAVSVPMLGVVDSLNVSATAAVLFYEAVRQRQGSV